MDPETSFTVTADQRLLLLYLLHAETVAAVHAVVTAPNMNAPQKTTHIINQMDFVFSLRIRLWELDPDPVDELFIGDMQRQVLERILEGVEESNMTADMILLYRAHRRELLLKLSPAVGFLTSAEAAAPGALKFS